MSGIEYNANECELDFDKVWSVVSENVYFDTRYLLMFVLSTGYVMQQTTDLSEQSPFRRGEKLRNICKDSRR